MLYKCSSNTLMSHIPFIESKPNSFQLFLEDSSMIISTTFFRTIKYHDNHITWSCYCYNLVLCVCVHVHVQYVSSVSSQQKIMLEHGIAMRRTLTKLCWVLCASIDVIYFVIHEYTCMLGIYLSSSTTTICSTFNDTRQIQQLLLLLSLTLVCV
jgi:hypothetical protein